MKFTPTPTTAGPPSRLRLARLLAPVSISALVLGGVSVAIAPAATAATTIDYIVTSAAAPAIADATVGADCTSGTGTSCTLLDALLLANAATTAEGDAVSITFADALDGAVINEQGSAGFEMDLAPDDGTLDNIAPWGANFMIDSALPVTLDFGNKVSLGTGPVKGTGVADQGDAMLNAKSDNITIKNFPNIQGGEAGIEVEGDNVTIENGHLDDTTVVMESAIGIGGPEGHVVHNLTVKDVVSDTNCLYAFKIAPGRSVDGLTFDGDTFTSPAANVLFAESTHVSNLSVTGSTFTSPAYAFQWYGTNAGYGDATPIVENATLDGNTFAGTGTGIVLGSDRQLKNVAITNNTFTGPGYGYDDEFGTVGTPQIGVSIKDNTFTGQVHSLVLWTGDYSDADISGNSFIDQTGGIQSTIWIKRNGAVQTGGSNAVDSNTFTQTTGADHDKWAIYAELNGDADGASTGWAFTRNDVEGYLGDAQAPITVGADKGTTPMWGNTYGTGTRGTTDATEAEGGTAWFVWNSGSANNRVQTWRPTDVSYKGGKVTFTAAPVTDQISNNQPPAAGPVTLYVYWTADDKAEVYLGKITDVAAAGKFTIDSTKTGGFLRLQTEDAAGNFSQYSGESSEAADWATLDDDGDGLSNGQELALGTDPTKPDTDGDGLPDGAEVNTYKTNPLKADTDGDGLKDGFEVKALKGCAGGTNPLKADSDGDGLKDGAEEKGFTLSQRVRYGDALKAFRTIGHVVTNPCAADTDHDGLSDSTELHGWTIKTKVIASTQHQAAKAAKKLHSTWHRTRSSRKATYVIGFRTTDPTKPDTDGDGLGDRLEVKGGNHRPKSDPDNFDTDFGGVADGLEVKVGHNPSKTGV